MAIVWSSINACGAFSPNQPTLEQAIADLQTWLRESLANEVELYIEHGNVDLYLWSQYGQEARCLEPVLGNVEQTITTAITKALNAVRN